MLEAGRSKEARSVFVFSVTTADDAGILAFGVPPPDYDPVATPVPGADGGLIRTA